MAFTANEVVGPNCHSVVRCGREGGKERWGNKKGKSNSEVGGHILWSRVVEHLEMDMSPVVLKNFTSLTSSHSSYGSK